MVDAPRRVSLREKARDLLRETREATRRTFAVGHGLPIELLRIGNGAGI